MKIVILSGSPKGNLSVSLEYWKYIQTHFLDHQYRIHHIGQKINLIETKNEEFKSIINDVKNSDLIVWCFPVYYTLIPSQLKRFIELIFQREQQKPFFNKYTTSFSTSIHFFDQAAHQYMELIVSDLNMQYLGAFSADFNDIYYSEKRKNFRNYARIIFEDIAHKRNIPSPQSPLEKVNKINLLNKDEIPTKFDPEGKQIVIVADLPKNRPKLKSLNGSYHNLKEMVQFVEQQFKPNPTPKIVNINELDIKGPCLGCMKCSYDNTCVYEGKDEFNSFWMNTVVKESDILIFAGALVDHYFSSRWKMIFDRSYFLNHTPYVSDKQMIWIISGNQYGNHYLREIIEAYTEFQRSNLVEIIWDNDRDARFVTQILKNACDRAIRYAKLDFKTPKKFPAVGTEKIFRDDVYSRLRFICQADHRSYKDNGIYDTFPQNDKFSKKLNRKLMFFMKFKKIRKEVYNRATKELWKPIHKIAIDPEK